MPIRLEYVIDKSSLNSVFNDITDIVKKTNEEYTKTNNFQDSINLAVTKSQGSGPLSANMIDAIAKDLGLPIPSDRRTKAYKKAHAKAETIVEKINEATQQAEETTEKTVATTQEAKRVESSLREKIAHVTSAISAATGFLALFTAVTGNAQNRFISLLLTVASSSAALASSYFSVGVATSNWLLVAAAGSLFSNTATIINSVNSYQDYQESQRLADLTRIQQLQEA